MPLANPQAAGTPLIGCRSMLVQCICSYRLRTSARTRQRVEWSRLCNDEMGGTYGTRVGGQKCIRGFGGGNLKEWDHLKYLSLDGGIILKWTLRKRTEGCGLV